MEKFGILSAYLKKDFEMKSWLKNKIEKFTSRPSDAYCVIGGGVEGFACYAQLQKDLENEDVNVEIQDVLSEEDFEALENYIRFGQDDDGTVNDRLIIELHDTVYGLLRLNNKC